MTENKFTFVELVECREVATWGRRTRQTRELKTYQVLIAGAEIGTVYERLATFETRTAGRRYVNTRWQAPRWFYDCSDKTRRTPSFYRSRYDTRQQAAECLYAEYLLVEAQQEKSA